MTDMTMHDLFVKFGSLTRYGLNSPGSLSQGSNSHGSNSHGSNSPGLNSPGSTSHGSMRKGNPTNRKQAVMSAPNSQIPELIFSNIPTNQRPRSPQSPTPPHDILPQHRQLYLNLHLPFHVNLPLRLDILGHGNRARHQPRLQVL